MRGSSGEQSIADHCIWQCPSQTAVGSSPLQGGTGGVCFTWALGVGMVRLRGSLGTFGSSA